MVRAVLPQKDFRRRLVIAASHDYQTMLREPDAFGECNDFIEIARDHMREIGFRARVVADEFQTIVAVDHQYQFAAERQEGNVGMWSEAALARQSNARARSPVKPSGDLRLRCVELRAAPFDLATERAEPIRIDRSGQFNAQAQPFSQDWSNDTLFGVHRGQHRLYVVIIPQT